MSYKSIILVLFLIFGILIIPGSVFAEQKATLISGSTMDVNFPNFVSYGFVPVLKAGRIGTDDIQEFMALPLEYKIFIVGIGTALILFMIWYVYIGKYKRLFLRIPIIIAWLLLILVPLYLFADMTFFITAAIALVIVLIVTWWTEHGRHMSKSRLAGLCLVLALVVGLPVYYYVTAEEDITDVTVSSKNASLAIIDYKVYRYALRDESEVKFEGYVKNNGNTAAEFVQVNVTAYDANGKIVANDTAFLDDNKLMPGTTSPFGELSSYYGGYLEDPQKQIVRVKLELF